MSTKPINPVSTHTYPPQPSSATTRPSPTIKPKVSTTRLRPRHIPSSSLSSPPASILRSKTDPTVPTISSIPLVGPSDNSSVPRRRPSALAKPSPGSSLPKPMAPSAMTSTATIPTVNPSSKPRTSPPTKQYAAFSMGTPSSKAPSSVASSNSSNGGSMDKRPRNVIKRKNSSTPSNNITYTNVRTGSTTSANGSTTSITSTSSFNGSRSGSVLGISLPATSSSSLIGPHYSLSTTRSRSGSTSSTIPKLATRDLPPPINIGTAYSSGSSTYHNESPGNFSITSTPTSASSHSPGFAPPGFKLKTHSPSRPPVTRNRSGSITRIMNEMGDATSEKGLTSVRESTTSTSSSSTIRAGDYERKKSIGGDSILEERMVVAPPPPMPKRIIPQIQTSASNIKGSVCAFESMLLAALSPRIASPASSSTSSPRPPPSHFGTFRSKSSNAVPVRPTREGTSELHAAGLGVTIPVIHSNLTAGPGSLARTRSKSTGTVGMSLQQQRKTSATPPLPSPSFPPSAGARRPSVGGPTGTPAELIASPTIGFPYSSATAAASPATASPTARKRSDSNERSRDRSPTRASPGKPSRPGFFRGRSKTAESEVEKAIRKGPAAGTGHEGYGKYNKTRGRSGSTNGSWGRSGSSGSVSDNNTGSNTGSVGRRSASRGSRPEMDDYYIDKLKPVVLAGGGNIVENHNVGSADFKVRKDSFSEGGIEMSRGNSAQGPAHGRGSSAEGKRPASREGQHTQVPTNFRPRRAATPIPAPINTSTPPVARAERKVSNSAVPKAELSFTPPMGHHDTYIVTDLYSQISPPLASDPLPSKPTKGRWAFLRPQAQTKAPSAPQSATAGRNRPHPHYVNLDPVEQQQAAQFKEMVKGLRNQAKEAEPATAANYSNSLRRKGQVHSMLLPEPPLPLQSNPLQNPASSFLQSNFGSPVLGQQSPQMQQAQQQQRQLMPAIVLNSVEAHKQEIREAHAQQRKAQQAAASRAATQNKIGSPKPAQGPSGINHRSRPSESQIQQQMKPKYDPKPRAGQLRLQTHLPRHIQMGGNEASSAPAHIGPRGVFDKLRVPEPAMPKQPPQDPQPTVTWQEYQLASAAANNPAITPGAEPYDPLELKGKLLQREQQWPVRKDSVAQVSSDEEEEPVTAIEMTPIAPQPPAPVQEVEDIWDEYDDIEDFISQLPAGLRESRRLVNKEGWKSNTSSLGSPFPFDDIASRYKALTEVEDLVDDRAAARTGDSPTIPDSSDGDSSGCSCRTVSTVFEVSPRSTICSEASVSVCSTAGCTGVVPPRIQIQPFNSDISASTAMIPDTPFSVTTFLQFYGNPGDRNSGGLFGGEQSGTTRSNGSNKSNGSNGSGGSTGTILEGGGLEDEMKLRLWALLTSRWLSFDRVLVSPAHEHLVALANSSLGPKSRVLVVDGLGTEDWSFYCALNYPSAVVYNLSPSVASSSPGTDSPTGLGKPPNHRQISHPSFTTMFPFPGDFFDVVCFRFLPSSSYPALPFVLSECRRVLAPGGHIEVSAIDADLLNMGNRTKRAVDLNKGIMQRECEESNINNGPRRAASVAAACARPASERITRLLEKGFEGVNRCLVSLPVVGHVDGSLSGSGSLDIQGEIRRPTNTEDPNVNEVVSKVGRWWYTRCYERVITGAGESPGRSMWNDRALLRECKKKKAGFKMLIAHARKPVPPPSPMATPDPEVVVVAPLRPMAPKPLNVRGGGGASAGGSWERRGRN